MKKANERRRFFDSLAREWDETSEPSEAHRLEEILAALPFNRGDAVLDAGCGTGRLAPLLKKRIGSSGMLVEADFSLAMLRQGQQKFRLPRLYFLQADVQRLPLAGGCFDAVVCFALFPHLAQPQEALKEFHRILKAGGRLIILHLMGREEMNALHAKMAVPVRHDRLPPDAEMTRLLREAAFRRPKIHDSANLYLVEAIA